MFEGSKNKSKGDRGFGKRMGDCPVEFVLKNITPVAFPVPSIRLTPVRSTKVAVAFSCSEGEM